MFEKFYPDKEVNSAYEIDYEALYRQGYRGLIYDIDNTLTEHGAPATERAIELMKRLKQIGFGVCLLSNNKEERVKMFNEQIHVQYIHKAGKPKTAGYEKAMELIGTNRENTIFIGDQIFTDIYGANRTGLLSYLVQPIGKKEEIQIVLKRYLEKIVLHFYHRRIQS